MAEKKTEKGGISPTLLLTVAAGLGLIIFGLNKLGGPKGTKINAKFEFDHAGPVEDLQLSVRFGRTTDIGIFYPNPAVTVVKDYRIESHAAPIHVEQDVLVIIPAAADPAFPLPYTYDAEARLIDKKSGEDVATKVVTTSVFVEDANFGVTML